MRSIVVGLDFFGPLAVALGDLKRAAMLGEGGLPWIASLHDLEVISKVIERPAEFLLYLRRRADSGVATLLPGRGGGLIIYSGNSRVNYKLPVSLR